MLRRFGGRALVLGVCVAACAGEAQRPQVAVTQSADGMTATIGGETLRVTVCSDAVVHVVASMSATREERAQPWLLGREQSCAGAKFVFAQTSDAATITTAAMKVSVSLKRGNLNFADASGKSLLREGGSEPRTYDAVEENGQRTFHLADRFAMDAQEALYGLGQHQSGLFNYRGSTVELGQNNTDIAIPLLLSTRGYAVLWNTAALSYADNRFPQQLKLTAQAGDAIDYFVIYGPEFDAIIHRYRAMTGHVPMLPRWAYGFFQSKDRYESQQEVLDVAARYRSEHIPMDAIVQDWFWWKRKGDPEYTVKYPDPAAELKTLHDEHVHAMISVWAMFDENSKNFAALKAQHLDVPGTQVYDATSAAGREFFWKELAGKIFAQGWDAFWLDSSEPEDGTAHSGDAALFDRKLAIGSGAEYTNVFPLMHTEAVAQHWRAETDRKRVFLLTRSAFLGQQRVGAAVWSGDIYSSWWAFRKQVPAGLNFALSGNPYWTTDTAGYFQPFARPPNDPDYQELYARWFEFSTFCPIMRTHGHRPANELWTYDKVEPVLLSYDRLRYRLMPYVYSLAWRVTSEDDTIERPLVMDFRGDQRTWDIGDEFLFGPSILVAPVTEQHATRRSVYLPAGGWYDFWSGERVSGGKDVEAAAPLEREPLYVRAGAIVPMGPEVEYADQNPDGPVELRVYRGADGSFALYEDAGDSYDYEKGARAVIPIRWDEAKGTLTLGAREGSYPGMAATRVFRVVWVGEKHGVGEAVEARADRAVTYNGAEIVVRVPAR